MTYLTLPAALRQGVLPPGSTAQLTAVFALLACSNTAAVVYPVYKSFKAIESKDAKDDTQW